MLVVKILLGYLGATAVVFSFIGAMFAGGNGVPIDAPRMKFYRWALRGGLMLLALDLLIIIVDLFV